MKEIIKKLNNNLEIIIPLVFAVGVSATFFISLHFFDDQLLGIIGIVVTVLLAILFLIIIIISGLSTIKSLFVTGAGISLLIFLAQSYCEIPARTLAGNNALKSLLAVGLLYVAYDFFRSLYRAFNESLKRFSEKKKEWQRVFVVLFFLIFTFFLVWAIYQVINPAVLNLCVYK